MCSKRCANPVRPGFSFFEPTWYHWFTCTIGSFRSTWRMTWRPFGSVYFWNSIWGTDVGEGDGADVAAAGAAVWPDAAADRAKRIARDRAGLRGFTFLLTSRGRYTTTAPSPKAPADDPAGSNVDTHGRAAGFTATRAG